MRERAGRRLLLELGFEKENCIYMLKKKKTKRRDGPPITPHSETPFIFLSCVLFHCSVLSSFMLVGRSSSIIKVLFSRDICVIFFLLFFSLCVSVCMQCRCQRLEKARKKAQPVNKEGYFIISKMFLHGDSVIIVLRSIK